MKFKYIVYIILSCILLEQLSTVNLSQVDDPFEAQTGKELFEEILAQADFVHSANSPIGYPHFFTIDQDFINNCRRLIMPKEYLLSIANQRFESDLKECKDKISQELELLNQIDNSENLKVPDMTKLTSKVNKLHDRTLKTTKNIAMHFVVLLDDESSNYAEQAFALFEKPHIYPLDGTTFVPQETYSLLKAKNNLLEELKDMIHSGKFEQAREDADELKKMELLVGMLEKSILRPREQLDDFFDYDNYGRSSEIGNLVCKALGKCKD